MPRVKCLNTPGPCISHTLLIQKHPPRSMRLVTNNTHYSPSLLSYLLLLLLLRPLPRPALLARLRAEELLDLSAALEIQPGADVHDGEVEQDVRGEDAEVAPVVAVEDVEAGSLHPHMLARMTLGHRARAAQSRDLRTGRRSRTGRSRTCRPAAPRRSRPPGWRTARRTSRTTGPAAARTRPAGSGSSARAGRGRGGRGRPRGGSGRG